MAEKRPQTLANHAKFHPPFHFVLVPIMMIAFCLAVRNAISNPSQPTIWNVIFIGGIIVGVFLIRIYPLKVQDRLIRLEERLRRVRRRVHDQDDAIPTHGVGIAQRLTSAPRQAVY